MIHVQNIDAEPIAPIAAGGKDSNTASYNLPTLDAVPIKIIPDQGNNKRRTVRIRTFGGPVWLSKEPAMLTVVIAGLGTIASNAFKLPANTLLEYSACDALYAAADIGNTNTVMSVIFENEE